MGILSEKMLFVGQEAYEYASEVAQLEAENEKLNFELELIGDICVDYDGYREAKDLMGLIDEIKLRAYGAAIHGKYTLDKLEEGK